MPMSMCWKVYTKPKQSASLTSRREWDPDGNCSMGSSLRRVEAKTWSLLVRSLLQFNIENVSAVTDWTSLHAECIHGDIEVLRISAIFCQERREPMTESMV
eukprot:TRINITY_DN4796_c0_g4_i1.p2 TRINITY_DN4796_c0_g4~~TRINITY_DN4796_c0_g4_i1.p2  ORF type:complete len:101 (+),score=9.27 TRINITY_DN4796_c0_g4_i1:230-532(+)